MQCRHNTQQCHIQYFLHRATLYVKVNKTVRYPPVTNETIAYSTCITNQDLHATKAIPSALNKPPTKACGQLLTCSRQNLEQAILRASAKTKNLKNVRAIDNVHLLRERCTHSPPRLKCGWLAPIRSSRCSATTARTQFEPQGCD